MAPGVLMLGDTAILSQSYSKDSHSRMSDRRSHQLIITAVVLSLT